MTAVQPEPATLAFYEAAARQLRPEPFMGLRDGTVGEVGISVILDFMPGDDTAYQLVLARRHGNLAVALLNCERRAGIVPFRADDQHYAYIADCLGVTNVLTAYAITAVVNRATEICLGRPAREAG